MSGKVFGIGLSKTGTTSLNQALIEMGLKSIHYPQRAELFSGDFRCFDGYDAATDIPVVPYYPQLDELYPRSKFILTVRDVEDWLQSMDGWLTENRRPNDFMLRMRIAVYGVVAFHPGRLRYVYEKHVRDVKEYFRERPGDLLIMNICAGEGWEKLCPFLNRQPPPSGAFPFVIPGSRKRGLSA